MLATPRTSTMSTIMATRPTTIMRATPMGLWSDSLKECNHRKVVFSYTSPNYVGEEFI